MTNEITQISSAARSAVVAQDWAKVAACANDILRRDPNSAEGYFLAGVVERVSKRPAKAAQAFEKSLSLDNDRYDAAIELANQYSVMRRNKDAADLLLKYASKLENSPMYLDLAGTVYTEIGMPEKAWPLYEKANVLQPGVDLFQANLAACGVYLGKVDEAKDIYLKLLQRFPNHMRNHYRLARLSKAEDDTHVEQMKKILSESEATPDKNIFMYFALGKELEDLGQWEESFSYYKMAGDTVTNVAKYDVSADIALIDKIIEVCDSDWLAEPSDVAAVENGGQKTPVFIVGLPRSGTTLTERIVSSHSAVQSVGETLFMQMVLRQESGIQSVESMTPEMIDALASKDMQAVADAYQNIIDYRLGDEPMFIDKLPFNFLFLGFIARAWPNARIIHLKRNPMDSCFSMYKQLFTWAYKFSYSLDNLGKYYAAYDRLQKHWQEVLGDRLIEVEYETLVTEQENVTRELLEKLGLDFEPACLEFDQNTAPSATASSVQVREKVHNKSVNKWRQFAAQLEPLKQQLENEGIKVE